MREMTDLEIYTVDNPQQLAVLRSKSRKVLAVTPSLVALAEQMLETMRNANGVGLAAPQVGVAQRLFVAELPEDEEANEPRRTFVFFNPEIVKGRGEQVGFEGCLSIPGYVGEVARQEQVVVKGLDAKGKPVRHKVEGYLARVFQHEIDHLDGILYTDRLTDPETFQPVEVGQEEAFEMEAAMETEAAAAVESVVA
jgi:peptide deformylase